jgi:putative PIN family toxin of toxin-antitoxin system
VRLVLDTNIVVSALLWRGAPYQLLQLARQRPSLKLYGSVALLEELADVLTRPALRNQLSAINKHATDVLQDYASAIQIIEVPPLEQPVCRDPDDDEVLALALAAQADLIVSGDQDLLVLRRFEGITISTAHEALAQLSILG